MPTTIYAADNDSLTGKGILKSIDDAATWTKLAPVMEFGSVAGNRILRSADGGATWSATLTADAQMSTVIADPLAASNLYAGSFGEGIFKSSDGGLTWSGSHTGIRGLYTNNSKAHSVAFDASAAAIVYAGTLHRPAAPAAASIARPTAVPAGSCCSSRIQTPWSSTLAMF